MRYKFYPVLFGIVLWLGIILGVWFLTECGEVGLAVGGDECVPCPICEDEPSTERGDCLSACERDRVGGGRDNFLFCITECGIYNTGDLDTEHDVRPF